MTFRPRAGRAELAALTASALLLGGCTAASAPVQSSGPVVSAPVQSSGPVVSGSPQGGRPDDGAYTVGLFGDVPYGAEGRAELPALVADMNGEPLAFSIHIGDIRGGGERCDAAIYTAARDAFESYRAPVVYTPGDNEWTDCHRRANGSYDPVERLAHLRSVFFPAPGRSLGQRGLAVRPQSAERPENARWTSGPVTFATVHVVGSNNNRAPAGRSPAQVAAANAEYAARNSDGVAWVRGAFQEAKQRGSRGVVLAMHADLGFRRRPAPSSGYADTLAALREETAGFDGQVALLHGDSHRFVHDKPLLDREGRMLENFTRVQTFGDADTHWVALRVDPSARGLFTVEPRIVPSRR